MHDESASGERQRRDQRRDRWLESASAPHPGRAVIVAATLGSGMTLLDGTVVNVALKTIGEDLGASVSELQWVTNGYLLSLASLILLGGSLGDRFGRRRVFVIGTVWFAVASLLCGIAPTPLVLIVARILQGVGAALLMPGSLAMIQGAFVREDRARAIGTWSGLGAIAAAVGPLVGGALVQYADWRWIFLINLPIAATHRGDRAARGAGVAGSRCGRPVSTWSGALLGALALGGTTYALIEWGGLPGWSGRRAWPLVASVWFVLVERTSRHPMLAARHLRRPHLQRRQRDDAGGVRRAGRLAVLPGDPAADRQRLRPAAGRAVRPADHDLHGPACGPRRRPREPDRAAASR